MTSARRDFLKFGLAFVATMPSVAAGQDAGPPVAVSYFCPMHPDVQSKVPGKCPKCNMKLLVSKVEGAAGTQDFFICPMHPEVMTAVAGNCPKCKMKLVKSAPPETSDYIMKVELMPKAPKPGGKVTFRFAVFHPITEKQVKEFNILHDMPFHLFIISQDFEHFEHVHPIKQTDGSFTLETVLPKAGFYKIFCDFFPAGGLPQVTQHSLITAGYDGDLVSSQARLDPDKTLVKTIEGTRFEFTMNPFQIFAGRPAELRYHLVDAKTGEPVRDLQPYLGAWGHTLILSEDATDYLHSHPSEMIPEEVDRSNLKGGPDVTFDTFFPRPANYRIWSQFQRQGKIITVSYTVYVPKLG